MYLSAVLGWFGTTTQQVRKKYVLTHCFFTMPTQCSYVSLKVFLHFLKNLTIFLEPGKVKQGVESFRI